MSRTLRRLGRLVVPEARGVALGVGLQVATLASGILLMGTSAWLIARAAQRPSIAALGVAIAGVRLFGIARGVLRYLERLASHDATLGLLARLRGFLYARLLPLAPARLVGERGGDLLARLLADVDSLEAAHLRLLAPVLAAVSIVALLSAFLLARGGGFALAFLAAALLGGALGPALQARLAQAPGRRLVRARARLSARLVEGIQGVAELLAFGRAQAHADELRRLARDADAEEARLARGSALGSALTGVAADLGAVALLALAASSADAGRLSAVEIAVLPLLVLAAFEALAPLPAAAGVLGTTREAARRVFELLDAVPAVAEPEAPLEPGPGARLEAHGLVFRYPDGTLALDGVDLTLERGRLLAVVGPSGSGKSTLAALLLRHWDVPPGTLLLDGIDVRRLATDAVRARIAFASPRERLFTATLGENLRLARPEASPDELRAALTCAGLQAFCDSLPDGLDTWLGEQGLRLSGGEGQRLLLARALLRDAPLLVLDEPTAHLDVRSEAELLAALFAGKARRATLLVTHRLSALQAADEILVLRQGRPAERGRFEELAAAGGPFSRMLAAERDELALPLPARGPAGPVVRSP